MDDSDRRQLDRLIAILEEVLGSNVLGAYLFGSAVLGGLRPESDLDVLAVTERATIEDETRRLVERLLDVSGRPTNDGRNRRLELTLVVHAQVRPWRFPPRLDFQYGDWWRDEFAAGDLEPWPSETDPDLATLVAMAWLANRPLLGPPPAELFDPVPPGDLVRAATASLDGLLADLDRDTRNVVLTLARMWCTVATSDIRSKDAAADWVLPRLSDRQQRVLARARAVYLGEQPDGWDDLRPETRAYAESVAAELRRLSGP